MSRLLSEQKNYQPCCNHPAKRMKHIHFSLQNLNFHECSFHHSNTFSCEYASGYELPDLTSFKNKTLTSPKREISKKRSNKNIFENIRLSHDNINSRNRPVNDTFAERSNLTLNSDSSVKHPSCATSTRRVQFSDVQVQEYCLTLGDPSYSTSYPLSLDWAHTEARVMSLDAYECAKPKKEHIQKGLSSFHLSKSERRMRLVQVLGLTPSDMKTHEQLRRKHLVDTVEREKVVEDRRKVDRTDSSIKIHDWLTAHIRKYLPDSKDGNNDFAFLKMQEGDNAFEPVQFNDHCSDSLENLMNMDCSILNAL